MDITKIPCENLRCEYLNGAYNDFANLLGIGKRTKQESKVGYFQRIWQRRYH